MSHEKRNRPKTSKYKKSGAKSEFFNGSLLGILPFFIEMLLEQKRLKKDYPDAYREALKISKDTAKEVTMLIALFNVVVRKDSREDAYAFVRGIFQKVAVHSMTAFYQIDELVQCEGDPIENFTKFNVAWFAAMQEPGRS